MQSSKLGIRLAGGKGTNHIPGDPGIFVVNVRPGSIADGKLYPGDRIVSVSKTIFNRSFITFILLLFIIFN